MFKYCIFFILLQVKVLELENMLQNERIRLGELRRKHYALAGVYDETDEAVKPTQKPGILKKPQLPQKPNIPPKGDYKVWCTTIVCRISEVLLSLPPCCCWICNSPSLLHAHFMADIFPI